MPVHSTDAFRRATELVATAGI